MYSPFHFSLKFGLKLWHVHDQILAEMVLISPKITATMHNITHHVASVDRKTVN